MSNQNDWDNESLNELREFWGQPTTSGDNTNGNNEPTQYRAKNPPIQGNPPVPGTPPHFTGNSAMAPAPQVPGQLNKWNFRPRFSQTGSFHNGWADVLDFNDRPDG